MKMSKKEFNMIVNAFCNGNYCDIYVIFKYAYTEKELEKERYELRRLDLECFGANDIHVWDTDWDEGQEFIDLHAIYTEDDLLNLILAKDIKDLIKDRLMETALNCVGILCDESEVLEGIANRIDSWVEEAEK